MASAREYSHLTDGVRREVVAMIEKAVSQKRKGEGLELHDSQCSGFIDSQLEMVRETSFLGGVAQRAMTLVCSPEDPSTKPELTLGVSMVGAEGQAASKAAKIWGSKAAVGSTEAPAPRSRRRAGNRGERSSSRSSETETVILDTERVLRARRDASVVVNVREREVERGRGGRSRPAVSWSSVSLTAEEIFRECSGKCWLGEKEDRDHVYCTVKQSCNIDRDFSEYLSNIQLHLYGVSKLERFS